MNNAIFLDGVFIPANATLLKSLSPGIVPGEGVFETMRAYGGRIFAIGDHLRRLKDGLGVLNIDLPLSGKEIERQCYLALRSNGLKNARVRLTVWREGRETRVSIVTLPYQPYPRTQYLKGFNAVISDAKLDQSSKLSGIKSINYLPFLTAYARAKKRGYDEAILLNRKGEIVEGSRSNVFFVRGGCLFTPALACGCLKGITRKRVIRLAGEMGVPIKEVKAGPPELFGSDEAFLTNSLMELMPLTCVSGRLIGDGTPGRLTLGLLKNYRKSVGRAAVSG